MGKSSPSNAGILAAQSSNYAADLSYKFGQDQLAWAKAQFAKQEPWIEQVVNQEITSQKKAADYSKSQQDFYNTTYKPLETKYTN